MKKVLIIISLSAILAALTACDIIKSRPESVPQSVSEYVHPIVKTPPESGESSAESSAETSDVSPESEPESVSECPYKVGDLVGPDDFPSRGRAAYMVAKMSVYPEYENLNSTLIELFDEHDNSLYREKDYGEPEIRSYEYDDNGNKIREYFAVNYYCGYEYDENGRLVSYEAFRDGKPVYSGVMFFDEHGELSEAHATHDFGGGEPEETVSCYDNIYDDGGMKISSTIYYFDQAEIWEINDYEYDGDILKRRVCTEPRDDHKTIREYEYDDNKNLVNYKVTVFELDGSVKNTYREERSYNADGKIEQMLYYNKDGKLEMKELYEYTYKN